MRLSSGMNGACRAGLWWALGALLLCICLLQPALAQKRSDRAGKDKGPPSSGGASGPKRTDRTVAESERVKVITKTEFVKVAVAGNKGYLSVVAVNGASVTMTALAADSKKQPPIRETIKDEDGSLNLINLQPGKYKLLIEHPDYNSFTENIQVDPASPATFVATNKMVSKFGAIRLAGLQPGARVFLDEQPVNITPAMSDGQGIVIERVTVGSHRLRVSKAGYIDLATELQIAPGRESVVPGQLDLARVTLSLTSQPGGRVYVGSEEKATIPSAGTVAIQLPPGNYTVTVSKDGFQDWKRDLALSLARNPVAETAELVPVPASAEGDWQPTLGARKWFPQNSAWRFGSTGATIRGDQVVLFDTEQNRDFNTYRDFRLEFDTVFSNDRGVAWVARAKDLNNYYLFEIAVSPGKTPNLNFYICRDGRLQLLDSRSVVEKIDRKGDSFHIIFQARGGMFEISMTIASIPSTSPYRIGIFQDETLLYGGVGFRGKDLSEALLQTFFILPVK